MPGFAYKLVTFKGVMEAKLNAVTAIKAKMYSVGLTILLTGSHFLVKMLTAWLRQQGLWYPGEDD